jgi:hypothetical protein
LALKSKVGSRATALTPSALAPSLLSENNLSLIYYLFVRKK